MALCKENVSFDGIEIAGIEIPSQEQNRKKKVLNWCLGKTNGKQQGEGQDGLLGVMQKMPGVRTTGWGEDGAFSGSSLFSQPPPPPQMACQTLREQVGRGAGWPAKGLGGGGLGGGGARGRAGLGGGGGLVAAALRNKGRGKNQLGFLRVIKLSQAGFFFRPGWGGLNPPEEVPRSEAHRKKK